MTLTPELMKQALINAHNECVATPKMVDGGHNCLHAEVITANAKLFTESIMMTAPDGLLGVALHFLHVGYALARLEAGLITAPSEPPVDKSKPIVVQKEGAA